MEAKCSKCNEMFPTGIIVVTYEGFFCKDCVPGEVTKRFISLDMSWIGVNALLDYVDGNANVDQLMIIDKMIEAIRKKMMALLQEMVKNGGELQESDSQSMGTGDD